MNDAASEAMNFELGHPLNLAFPERPYDLFHYLSRGSAVLALEQGGDLAPGALAGRRRHGHVSNRGESG